MMTNSECEKCKYSLIYIDKVGNRIIRCYKHYMTELDSVGKLITPPYYVVTINKCGDYAEDTNLPPESRTYHAGKRKEQKDEQN